MKGKLGIWIFWTGYFTLAALAAVLQLLSGDFPSSFFEFPVNVASLLLWVSVIWVIFREYPESAAGALLASRQTTCITLCAFLTVCIVQGLSPVKVTGTWWFIAARIGRRPVRKSGHQRMADCGGHAARHGSGSG